jgi:hypothetical protein
MVRMTWLQRRSTVYSLAGLTVATSILSWALSHGAESAAHTYLTDHCTLVASRICTTSVHSLASESSTLGIALGIALILPIAVGVFVGAPLIARELESGTFRFSWTQGIGRRHWVVASTALLGAIAVIAALMLGLLAQWWSRPIDAAGLANHWQSGQFDATAWTLPAWTAFSLALGVLLGVITKRVLSAMALSAAALGGVFIANFLWVDRWLLSLGATTTTVSPSSATTLVLGQLNFSGVAGSQLGAPAGSWLVSGSLTNAQNQPVPIGQARTLVLAALRSAEGHLSKGGAIRALLREHYHYVVALQTDARYGALNGLDAALVTTVALALMAVTLWLVHRSKGARVKPPRRMRRNDEARTTTTPFVRSLKLVNRDDPTGTVETAPATAPDGSNNH